MSNLYAKKSGNYVVVDFDNVTAKGLKGLLDDLKRGGQPVSEVEATNRKTKKDGLYIKRAKLVFENGQAITLFIGDQGDIYQMTMNGTRQPVPDATNEQGLAKELVTRLKKNQDKFDKSQLKKADRVKLTATNKPVSRSLKARVTEAKQQLSQLNSQVADFNSALSQKQGELSVVQSDESKLRALLDAEKADTKQLKEQLQNAKGAM